MVGFNKYTKLSYHCMYRTTLIIYILSTHDYHNKFKDQHIRVYPTDIHRY